MSSSEIKNILIYTDGACSGNPGPGAYAAVLLYKSHKKIIKKGFRKTTNNRMELMGVIESLKSVKQKCNIRLYTDSAYIVNAVNKKWIDSWQKKNWVNSQKQKVKNRDLWEQLIELMNKNKIEFIWVKGHSDNRYNEECDMIARETINSGILEKDTVYEYEN